MIKLLNAIAEESQKLGIKRLFLESPSRASKFQYTLEGFLVDHSKTHLSDPILDCYLGLAEQLDFDKRREQMFAGDKINVTEQRAVLHTLLRSTGKPTGELVNESVRVEAKSALSSFRKQIASLEAKLDQRLTPIKNIIHVGIGGSSLGTQLLSEAVRHSARKVNIHFLANIDAHQLDSILAQCSVDDTLIIGVSKTFTTTETITNLNSICGWLAQHGIDQPKEHLIAITANHEKAIEYGIEEDNVVAFPEWVGGRFSVWSSVSLSAALAIGTDQFDQFLLGASEVDQYFYSTPIKENACFIGATLDHFYNNFMQTNNRAVFAYDYRLRSLVPYLQQLETESNGKDRELDGQQARQKTSMVIWGGVGTDVQHSVFQMLHQGTVPSLSEFILVKKANHAHAEHHRSLLANGVAQGAALLKGRTEQEARESTDGSDALVKSKIFSGDRPSSTILLEELSAKSLGALLAYYEHRTFCAGVLMNVNSFDQMGVELGKQLANEVFPLIGLSEDNAEALLAVSELDESSKVLIKKINL